MHTHSQTMDSVSIDIGSETFTLKRRSYHEIEVIADAIQRSFTVHRSEFAFEVVQEMLQQCVRDPAFNRPLAEEPNTARFCVDLRLVPKRLHAKVEQVGTVAVTTYDDLFKQRYDVAVLRQPVENVRDHQSVVVCGHDKPRIVAVQWDDESNQSLTERLEEHGYEGPWVWFDETHEHFEVMRRLCMSTLTL